MNHSFAFWLRGGGPEGPEQPRVAEIPIGLSMLTASDLDDAADPRVAFNLPRWRRATTPDPAQADWAAWEALLASASPRPERMFAMTTRGSGSVYEVRFEPGDWLVFGSETQGLPEALREGFAPAQRLRLPMRAGQRSLNLSNAVAVTVFEAWRQNGFAAL